MSTVGTLYDETIKNGMYVLLATNTAAHSATLDFTGLGGPYTSYMFDISGVKPSPAGANLWMQVSSDNGATFKTTDYNYQSTLFLWSGSPTPGYVFYGGLAQGGTWNNNFYVALSVDAGNGVSGRVRSLGLGVNHRQWLWDCQSYVGGPVTQSSIGSGFLGPALAINAVRFAFDGGNYLESGVIRMYGLRTGAEVP